MRKTILIMLISLAPMTAQAQWAPWNPNLPNQTYTGGTSQPTSFCNGTTCTYTPLEPLNPWQASYPSLQSYLQAAFSILLTLGALFAVVMLTLSGIRYMLSESFTDKARAVQRIRSSVLGLLLLASSWLILNTINPNLLVFNIRNIPVQGTPTTQAPQNTNSPITVSGIQTYTANSVELQQLLQNGGIENTQLQSLPDGRAVVLVPNQNIPSYATYLNEYSKGCESAQGKIEPVLLPTNSTAYFCLKV